ncbi:MAG: hypothetical protein ACTIJ6_11485, partial [Leucobacter sp.]
ARSRGPFMMAAGTHQFRRNVSERGRGASLPKCRVRGIAHPFAADRAERRPGSYGAGGAVSATYGASWRHEASLDDDDEKAGIETKFA